MALKKKHEKLGSLPADIIERIGEMKKDGDHRVQADCVQALWIMGQSENISDIETMLVSGSEMSRSSGAYLCGKLRLFQLRKQLENLTADPSWTVRKMAAISLLAFGDSGRSTLKNLMDYGTADQQIVSAFAVGLTDDSSAIEKLIEQSRSGSEMAEMATSLLLRLAKPAT
jgi:HEAT repeat protein